MIPLGPVQVQFEHVYDKEQRRVVKTIITDKEKRILGQGKTVCSKGDTFCKNRGRKTALKRALKRTDLTKAAKSQIWEAYRTEMTKNPRW